MNDNSQDDTTDVRPQWEDFQRAGAIVSHRINRDAVGANATIHDALDADRLPQLALALTELAGHLLVGITGSPGEAAKRWGVLVAAFAIQATKEDEA